MCSNRWFRFGVLPYARCVCFHMLFPASQSYNCFRSHSKNQRKAALPLKNPGYLRCSLVQNLRISICPFLARASIVFTGVKRIIQGYNKANMRNESIVIFNRLQSYSFSVCQHTSIALEFATASAPLSSYLRPLHDQLQWRHIIDNSNL